MTAANTSAYIATITCAVTAESIQYELLTLGTSTNSSANTDPATACTTSSATGTSLRLTWPSRAGASPSRATAPTPLAGPSTHGVRCATPPSATTTASGASSHPMSSRRSTLENSSIVPETTLISRCARRTP
jgi:hypothetical protein